MDKKLEKVIQWTLYVLIVLIFIFGFLVPSCIYVLSEEPPDKIINWMNYAGIGLSLSSLALAFYSMFTSNKSQKRLEDSVADAVKIQHESNTVIREIQIMTKVIQNSQVRIESRLSTMQNVADYTDGTSAWARDKTGPNG